MNCQDTRDLLSAYVDRELVSADRREVARHLETCAACQEEVRSLLAMKDLLRTQHLPSMPADLVAEIEARTLFQPRPWSSLRWWAPVIAFATALTAWAVLHFRSPGVIGPQPTIPVAQGPSTLPASAGNHMLLAWSSTSDSDTSKDLQANP